MTTETPAADAERERLIAGHTPGPWKAVKGISATDPMRCGVAAVRGETEYLVATIENGAPGDWCSTEEANAHLIASAPDMAATIATLTQENERYEDAMHKIRSWADAYPLTVFPEPDFKKADQVLTAAGMTLDAISASNMRHVINGVRKILDAALAAPEAAPKQSAEEKVCAFGVCDWSCVELGSCQHLKGLV